MARAIALLCLLCLGVPAVADAKRTRALKLSGKGHVPVKVFERGAKRLTGTLAVQTPAAAASPPQPGLLPQVVETVTEVLSAALGVTAREFSLVLSRDRVATGAVTLSYTNRGEDPHDLALRALDGQGGGGALPEVASLGVLTRKVTLVKGRYELLCTLPGHAAAGMRATLQAG